MACGEAAVRDPVQQTVCVVQWMKGLALSVY